MKPVCFEKVFGEKPVAALRIIACRSSRFGSKNDEGALPIHAGQPAGAGSRCPQRIVAAGVEDHQPHARLGRLQQLKKLLSGIGVVQCFQFARVSREIDRDQKILPANLDAMT